jgi:hypothetical protein
MFKDGTTLVNKVFNTNEECDTFIKANPHIKILSRESSGANALSRIFG